MSHANSVGHVLKIMVTEKITLGRHSEGQHTALLHCMHSQ